MTTGEAACGCKVVFGDETKELLFRSGEDTMEHGVGSGDDNNDLGLSSSGSSLFAELINVPFAVDDVRV